MELAHAGQIITTKKTILQCLCDNMMPVALNTAYLTAEYLNGQKHDIRLYSVCSRLYFFSKLVYAGKEGVRKPVSEQYSKCLFEAYLETTEEIRSAVVRVDMKYREDVLYDDHFWSEVEKCLALIEKLWCRSLSCVGEQIYIPELAYAFEYVIERRGELPEPEFSGEQSLFPRNYKNYNYTEGIAEYFENAMVSIF